MYIEIYGKPRTVTNYEVKLAANFFAETLMTKKLADSIDLDIEFIYNLDAYGYCCYQYENIKPRDFIIEIKNNMSYRKTMETLAHEMVHLKQYATGQMFQYKNQKGIRWDNPSLEPFVQKYQRVFENDLDYYDLPWEIEAAGRQEGLFYKYRKYVNELNEKVNNEQ